MLHIGIVASSAEGAALCYRTICVEGAELLGPYNHPEVSMHGHPFAQYVKCIDARDWAGVAELMLSSADFLIAPVNTVHEAFDLVEHRSPRPWLHIAVELANEAKHHGYKRLGVLGTRSLMEGPVYREKLKAAGIDHRVPGPEQRERIHRIIFDELVQGTFLPRTQAYFTEVIRGMKDEGCDAVALACTEIPLLMTPESSPLPMLDSTRILARAALRKAA
ncbi:MAG: aspartate racemase [Acidobacteria bacterium]|nr:MAG: aspartate racemase [Acidobacteriota bacterium]